MEETALYHHIGITTIFNFNYQLTTSNFILPARLYRQILCIMQNFVKKKIWIIARQQEISRSSSEGVQHAIRMLQGMGGEHPLNYFPPNLAEVLKTKMLEGKGFESLERLPCC